MTRYNPEASDDRSIPLLLIQAAHRGADDWSYDDALAVIANLLAERDDLAAKLAEAEQRGRQTAFTAGYVLACCNLQNLHGATVEACDVLAELGVTQPEIDALALTDLDADALAEIRAARKEDPVEPARATP